MAAKKPRGYSQSLHSNGPGRTPGAPTATSYKWLWRDLSRGMGILEIEDTPYYCERLSTNVFTLRVTEGHKITQYTVMVNGYCGCDGYMYTRHCKHSETFVLMKERGEI